MIKRDRYSSISLDLLLQYRTVLSRRTDEEGTTSWTAKVVGMPWCEASGSTRTEALRRVREMAGAKGAARAVDVRAHTDAKPTEPGPTPARGARRVRAWEGARTADA
jgi:hypothetical protein